LWQFSSKGIKDAVIYKKLKVLIYFLFFIAF